MTEHGIFMYCAKAISGFSKCVSRQVGCVIVKDRGIISAGVNGTPPGFINCNEKFPNGINCRHATRGHHDWSNIHEIHAEQNAIARAAKSGVDTSNSTVYCTLKPCMHCTKLLIAAGITHIIYEEEYFRNDDEQIDKLLNECNIKINSIDEYGVLK